MLFINNDIGHSTTPNAGNIFYTAIGTEHVTYPQGESRVLVVEPQGCV